MNYWLFIIMYDEYPESWQRMLELGVAAEDYSPEWRGEPRNVKALSQLKQGDFIVAAFKGHRFAGYATLTSNFYRGGPPLDIHQRDGQRLPSFSERFDAEWTVIPPDHDPPFVRCSDLKADGFDIDLKPGLCVKQIDERTFAALKARLDEAGAKRVEPQIDGGVDGDLALPEEVPDTEGLYEGAVRRALVNAYERNPKARRKCLAHYGYRCVVCGCSLEEIYGKAGQGIIRVHHLRELSDIRMEYQVDPIRDLRPVCPNCHAIIHSRKPAYSIEEVQGFLRSSQAAG